MNLTSIAKGVIRITRGRLMYTYSWGVNILLLGKHVYMNEIKFFVDYFILGATQRRWRSFFLAWGKFATG